jgi:hypothetical protein
MTFAPTTGERGRGNSQISARRECCGGVGRGGEAGNLSVLLWCVCACVYEVPGCAPGADTRGHSLALEEE